MINSSNKNLLVIGLNWPEPNSSAAGSRMLQILKLFLVNDWKITFACSARETLYSEDLRELGVSVIKIYPNDEETNIILEQLNPKVVIFDRFMIEEQFGWRVAEVCPNAIRILDTEDLHFHRNARETAVKQNRKLMKTDLFNTTAKREIASILRSDLSLIISEAEMKLLLNTFEIKEKQLLYLPFLVDEIEEDFYLHLPSFEQRINLMFIGNFLHKPNYDAVLFLKNKIWPLIHIKLPKVEMHIYGAYTSQKVKQLENRTEKFMIKGRTKNVGETMKNYRLLLAPLRFGAGLKGKIFDAIQNGVPCVTTSVGAEGVNANLPFNGQIADIPENIAQAVLTLYTDIEKWKTAQLNGSEILLKRFDRYFYEKQFMERLDELKNHIDQHRANNFLGQMMMHHRMQSTKFMSRWIETKNKQN